MMILNDHPLPAELESRAEYQALPPEELRADGWGQTRHAPSASLRLRWPSLNRAEWDLLSTEILAGAGYIVATGQTRLINEDRAWADTNYCVIERPRWQQFRNGHFMDVSLQITMWGLNQRDAMEEV